MIESAPHPHDIGVDPGAPLVDLPGHSSRGRLERVLRRGEFAITAELNPPDSANAEDVYERAKIFEGWVDGINATDGSGAHCHMSSVAICALLTRVGYSPVLQISCRDYNRIAIQGNVLGAAALQVGNVLCLTGDGVQCGDHPEAKPVFDLDSTALLAIIRRMRDEGKFLSGRPITTPPRVFIGAAENPFAPPYDFRPLRLAKKIAAGAQFIQTQYCFDLGLMQAFHDESLRHGARPAMLHPRRRRPARLGEDGEVDAGPCARRSYSGRGGQTARRREEPKGRRKTHLHRDDPGPARDEGDFRRARHGVPTGRIRLRDRP